MDAENIMSPLAREFMASDFHHRYPNYDGVSIYPGNRYMEEVESATEELAKKLFSAKFVELHAFSGTLACLATLLALTSSNDLVLELDKSKGGFSELQRLQRTHASNLALLRAGGLPFDTSEMNIDGEAAAKTIKREKPKLVILGATLFLFPHPVRQITEAAREVNALVAYDGSHVLGLIAGREFQDPLREGAFILMGSTHKTLPGPQSGLILSEEKNQLTRGITEVLHGSIIGNHHHYLVPGLAATFAESLTFGQEYAGQVVKNSKALAQALYERGFNVLCSDKGFTESHQVIVDVSAIGGGHATSEKLEKSNIIVTKSALPWDKTKSLYSGYISGLRFGTQEITRVGMEEREMDEIADYCKRILLKKDNPSKISKEISQFCKKFQKIHYCFDTDSEANAYEYFRMSNL